MRTFADLDLQLPEGVTALVGPNGAGKSTIVNALDVALYGGGLGDLLTRGEDGLLVELTFEHDGDLYRVRRGYTRGKSTCDFERDAGGGVEGSCANSGAQADAYRGATAVAARVTPRMETTGQVVGLTPASLWEPLPCESIAATNDRIVRMLGMTRATFRASAFVGQGDGAGICALTPGPRMELLMSLLGLEQWEDWKKQAAAERRVAETEAAVLRARIGGLQALVDTRPGHEADLLRAQGDAAFAEQALEDAARQLTDAQARLAGAAAAAERARAAAAEAAAASQVLAQAELALDDVKRSVKTVEAARLELPAAEQQAGQVPALEARLTELRAAQEQAREKVRALVLAEEARREVARLLALADDVEANAGDRDCDRCGQTLGGQAAKQAAASYRAEAAEQAAIAVEQQKAAAAIPTPEQVDVEPVEQALTEARAAVERRAHLLAVIGQHEERAASEPLATQAVAAARSTHRVKAERATQAAEAVGDTAPLEDAVRAAEGRVRAHRATLDEARARVTRAQVEVERCQQAEADLAVTADEHGTLGEQITHLANAERAFGKGGVPALILEAVAVPQIETEANWILAEFETPYAVQLRTQKNVKTDDRLRETLDIVVNDGLYDAPYEAFSGGERTRISLALRLALAGLLANRRGAQTRVLCIDEPDGLDAGGMDNLAQILARLAASTFSRVLLVSHQPQLAASFDQVLEVARAGERSRVGGVAQEVAA